jgi:hypothetical protein
MASCHCNDHEIHATCLKSPLTDMSLVPLTADYPTSNIALYYDEVSTVRWDSTTKQKSMAIFHAL